MRLVDSSAFICPTKSFTSNLIFSHNFQSILSEKEKSPWWWINDVSVGCFSPLSDLRLWTANILQKCRTGRGWGVSGELSRKLMNMLLIEAEMYSKCTIMSVGADSSMSHPHESPPILLLSLEASHPVHIASLSVPVPKKKDQWKAWVWEN